MEESQEEARLTMLIEGHLNVSDQGFAIAWCRYLYLTVPCPSLFWSYLEPEAFGSYIVSSFSLISLIKKKTAKKQLRLLKTSFFED